MVTNNIILQIVGVLLGGGLLQLTIFLLRRRAELRKLDTESDVSLLGAANAQIMTMFTQEKDLRGIIKDRDDTIEELRKQLVLDEGEAAKALERSQNQVTRLASDLARTRTDLSVVQNQLDDLTYRQSRSSRSLDQHDDPYK